MVTFYFHLCLPVYSLAREVLRVTTLEVFAPDLSMEHPLQQRVLDPAAVIRQAGPNINGP
jgi:hypothetical protein